MRMRKRKRRTVRGLATDGKALPLTCGTQDTVPDLGPVMDGTILYKWNYAANLCIKKIKTTNNLKLKNIKLLVISIKFCIANKLIIIIDAIVDERAVGRDNPIVYGTSRDARVTCMYLKNLFKSN
jgi:hypothetical protein